MSFSVGDPRARRAGKRSAEAKTPAPRATDKHLVQAYAELDLLRELREAGPAAVRALRLRSPDAAGALEGYLAAHAAAQGKREKPPAEDA